MKMVFYSGLFLTSVRLVSPTSFEIWNYITNRPRLDTMQQI